MKLKDIIDNSDVERVFQILLNRLNKYSKEENYSIEQIRSFYGAEMVAILIAARKKLPNHVIKVHGEVGEEMAFLGNNETYTLTPLCDLDNLDGLEFLEVETELSNENALAGILHDISILKEI